MPAGTERVTTVLANELANRGNDVHIITLTCANVYFELNPKIKVFTLGVSTELKFALLYPYFVFKLYSLIVRHKYTVFINVCVIMISASWFIRFVKRCKIMSWEHFNLNVTPRLFISALTRKLALNLSSKFVVLTHKDADYYQKRLGDKSKIACIPNPITIASEHKSDLSVKKVLAVGRYTAQKGFDLLLDAWEIVCRENREWQLEIVGDGEDKKILIGRAARLNISDRVVFRPPVKDIVEVYKEASVYVLSSRFEGMPLVMLEAMSMGLPVIAFDCEFGPSQLIKNDCNGYLIEKENVGKLAEALINLINDPLKQSQFSKYNIEFSKTLSIENIADKWERTFKEILG